MPGEQSTFATFPVTDPMIEPQVIFDACADHADALEEQIRVAIVIVDSEGEALATTYHKQAPLEASSEHAANAGDVSMGSIIAQLLKHIEVQQRAVTGSHCSIYDAFERTMSQMQKTNERLAAQNQALVEALRSIETEGGAEIEEVREEAVARTQAWNKLGELVPIVTDFAMRAAQSKMNGHAGHAAGAVNGTASVVD
jgi:hypothetical protein